MELSSVVDMFLRSPNPTRILDFLDLFGGHKDLLILIQRFEAIGVYVPFYYLCDGWCGQSRLHEIPTRELCENISMVLSTLKIPKVIEVAAGSGLLSARLQRMIPTVKFETTSLECRCPFNFSFTDVQPKAFQQIKEKGTPILISWLHEDVLTEFLAMIRKNLPSVIIFIGSASSINLLEVARLLSPRPYRYDHIIIPGPQINANTVVTGSNNARYTRNWTAVFFRDQALRTTLGEMKFHTLPPCPCEERKYEEDLINGPFHRATTDEKWKNQVIEHLLTRIR